VFDAWVSAKKYADSKLNESMGTVAGAFVFQNSVTKFADLPTLESTTAGWVYVVTGDGFTIDNTYTFTEVAETVESGDMIIATGTSSSDKKWSVIQRNVSGAVTADNNFTTNHLIFGAGSNKSVVSKAFDVDHFSVSSGSFKLAELSNNATAGTTSTTSGGNNKLSDLTLAIPTVSYDKYGRVTGVVTTSYTIGSQNHLTAATSGALGGVKLFSDTTMGANSDSLKYVTPGSGTTNRIYAVQLNSSN
jgi:hypothetical protein